ncbi:MAG: YeeE/YedE family protein, partial [Rhodobacteraceae bacterium]|nr:YeeE/YedE family protein [Paracoccaceae bacterium]
MTDTLASRPPSLPVLRRLDRGVIGLALTALAAGTVLLAQTVGLRHALLLPIGGAMGLTLYHAAFGFTGGWRRFVLEGRGAAIRAQMLMVALAAVVILPMLAHGTAFGRPLAGAIAPVGVSVLVGAALFGFGMQLGGGCGSGTLFTVGGGSGRMVVTLVFFCIGALIGTAHLGWWMRLPSLGAIGLGRSLGTGGAIALTLAGLAAVAAATAWIERRRHGSLERAGPAPRHGLARFTHGPWPLLAAAVALAALNIATLAT